MMAVLAVLAALLVPALARSGDNGRTICMNNMRQLGAALNLYAAENQDSLPWPNWGNDMSPPCPAGWLYAGDPTSWPSTIASGGLPSVSFFSYRQRWHLTAGVLWKYVLNGNAFLCPDDVKPSLGGYWSLRAMTLSTYLMNGAAAYYPSPNSQYNYATPKLSQVWSPACYILWEPDQTLDAHCYNDGAGYPGNNGGGAGANEGIGKLHGLGGNILSLSGAARLISSVDYSNQLSVPGPNLLYWNPKSSTGR